MTAIKAVWQNGQIVPHGQVDWPDGTEVLVEPLPKEESYGMREEDWPTTPEGIAELLKSWDEIGPLTMTPEEEADWNAWRQRMKEYTIANMSKGIEEWSE